MFLTAVSVIRSVWPFLRETCFQGRTGWQIVKTNKLVLFLTLTLWFSIYLNYLSIGKLLRIKTSPLQHTEPVVVEEVIKKNKKEEASTITVAKAANAKASEARALKQTPPPHTELVSDQQLLNNDIQRRLKKLKGER